MSASQPPFRNIIVDRREIEFSAAAIVQAIGANPTVALGLGLPSSPPDAIGFLPAQNAMEVAYGSGAEQHSIPIAAGALAALLVAYCMRVRITLPKSASKSVRVVADAVVLQLRLEFDSLPKLDGRKPLSKPVDQPRSMSWAAKN